jgi:hypothetical protein
VITPAELARRLKGDLSGKWVNIPGPGHRKRDRTLGILLDPKAPNGFRVHSFSGDDAVKCRAHVKKLLRELQAGDLPAVASGDPPVSQFATVRALAIWNSALPPEDTPVETYLRARRCELPTMAGQVLRYAPHCPFGAGPVPAMIALMRDVATGEPRGIHRTAFGDDGRAKRSMPDGVSSKRALGPSKSTAVMLHPLAPKRGVAEGIETALSASMLFDLPTWALLSAGGIAGFPVVSGIEELTIFADNDETGRKAAEKCGFRYSQKGTGGQVRYPSQIDHDWNDVAQESHDASDL